MNVRRLLVASALAIGVQVVLAMLGLALVERGVDVPIHWGLSGEANGFAPPVVAFLMTPALTAGLVALLAVIPRIEPRRENLARSAPAYGTLWVALLVFMTGLQAVVVASGLGAGIPINVVIGVGTGALFVILGNVMTTVRSNFLFGVRTPWTLTSELSWRKTHRVVGRLFVVVGLATIVSSLVATDLMAWVLLGGIVLVLAVAFVYSYVVWRDDPDRQTGSSAT